MQCYNVGEFDFDQGVYAADASGLGLAPGIVPREIGITHRSGVVTRFVFDYFKRDSEGDVTSFNYKSILGKDQVKIFND